MEPMGRISMLSNGTNHEAQIAVYGFEWHFLGNMQGTGTQGWRHFGVSNDFALYLVHQSQSNWTGADGGLMRDVFGVMFLAHIVPNSIL